MSSYLEHYDWSRLEGLGFDMDFVQKSLPESYKKGLTSEEQDIAKREAKETMAKAESSKVSSKELYKDWESDKRFRKRNKSIPKSEATKAFEDKFAESSGIDTALKNKAKKSGISLGILRQVFNRGMAAWRSGHRPGVAPQQWALGRVNSFITGKGKAREADSDLWKKTKYSEFKECGESGIPDWKQCKKKTIASTAEHLAQGAVSWETGKVLGGMVSAGLESRYGVPTEASKKIAESVVQALTATALDKKHLHDVDDVFKKMFVEFSAAMVGKMAHAGAESFLSSVSAQATIEKALPILAGKFAGISTAIAGGKVPSPAKFGRMLIERSTADTRKLLRTLTSVPKANFAEDLPSEDFLADLSMILLLQAFAKSGGKIP